MIVRAFSLFATIALASCGTLARNSEVPNAPYLGVGDRLEPDMNVPVRIVDSGPSATSERQHVEGYSCKNKLWDPDPSRENAIALMKRQASERGYNAIHSVLVEPDNASVGKNCWSGISATGIAFNDMPAVPVRTQLKPKH